MAILPTRTLEIEFDAGVWTDVSADVVAIKTRRGRNKESGAFETGTLVFTVRNDSRKYDPDHTAGAYYGKLRPNRRVRLQATYNAVTYPVFLGYIDRIAQVYGGPNDATAEFQVSDLFKILNRVELPDSVYAAEIATESPVALWKLDEPSGSTLVADSVGGYTLDAIGDPGFGGPGLVVRDPNPSVALTGAGTDTIHRYMTTAPLAGPPLSLELWYMRAGASTDGALIGQYSEGSQGAAWLSTSTTGVIIFTCVNGAGANTTALSTGVNLNDLAAHHIVATWAAGGALKIYVDGVDRTSGAPTLAATTFATRAAHVFVGGTPAGIVEFSDTGNWQYAAMYSTQLSGAAIGDHNAAGRTPWDDDDPGSRLSRVLDLAGLGAGDRDIIDPGTTFLQSTSLGGTALGYAQKIEETELGWLFVARDGKVTFFGHEYGMSGGYLTSSATLVDDDSGAGIPYRSVSADVDEARIVTRATVSRDGSVAVTYQDAAAIAEFEIIDETHDGLLHDSETISLSYAQWIVNTHKEPSTRVGTITLDLAANPTTMYPAILDLELGDRVTYKRKPQNTGSIIDLPMRVEAISHETGGAYWRTRLQLSPFNLGEDGYGVFIWGTTKWDQHVWGHGDQI